MPINQANMAIGNCQPLAVAALRRVDSLRLVYLIALGFIVGCGGPAGRLRPPDIDEDETAVAFIAEYDANKNSAIDGDELQRVPAIRSVFGKYDTDGDKQVTAEEIKARIEAWQIVPVAAMPLNCTVRLGRKPLANATVVLEPETPLTGQLKQATGTTDKGGFAQLSISLDGEPERRVNGVQCGLYKVRITAPLGGGRQLPAKYNSETQLGLEVAPDSSVMWDGLRFDL